MEEITGYIFRNTMEKHFGGVDKYFTPFIMANQNKILKTRDGREIDLEHNKGMNVVPQVLTNNAAHFNELALQLIDMGYEEINLNFGCPSATVVKKMRGSGIFKDLYVMEKLLEGIFDELEDKVKISVKTRVGLDREDDLEDILRVYNKYPIYELTVHPRLQTDFYNGYTRMEMFDYIVNNSKLTLVYNGDIRSTEDVERIEKQYGDRVKAVMIGRGAVANPGIFRQIKDGKIMDEAELKAFHDELFDDYASIYSEKDAMFKLKEIWGYLGKEYDGIDKQLKQIRKSNSRAELMSATAQIWNIGRRCDTIG